MVKQRNEINEKYQWDLSTIFPSDASWEEELHAITADLSQAEEFEGHLLDSADSYWQGLKRFWNWDGVWKSSTFMPI